MEDLGGEPSIQNALEFLAQANPQMFEHLKDNAPDDLIREFDLEGRLQGRASADLPRAQLDRSVMIAALAEAEKLCDSVIPKMQKRLKSAARLQLAAQISTAVGTAAILVTLSANKAITVALGLFTLAGSLLAIIQHSLVSTIGAKSGRSLAFVFDEIVNVRYRALSVRSKLTTMADLTTADLRILRELIKQGDEIARIIYRNAYEA